VPAISAKVFVVIATPFGEVQEVPREQTHRRVFDDGAVRFGLQERVPAVARVLVKTMTRSDKVNTVTEQVAQVSHFLDEYGLACIRVYIRPEEQRVATTNTYVFVVPGANSNLRVTVSQ
jgi:hypothetical protein